MYHAMVHVGERWRWPARGGFGDGFRGLVGFLRGLDLTRFQNKISSPPPRYL